MQRLNLKFKNSFWKRCFTLIFFVQFNFDATRTIDSETCSVLSFHLFLYLAATIIFVTNLEKIQQRYNVVYKYYIQGCTRLANQLPHPSFFFYFPLYMYFFLVKILLGSCYPQHHHHHLHHHWDYHHFFSDSIIPKSISCT